MALITGCAWNKSASERMVWNTQTHEVDTYVFPAKLRGALRRHTSLIDDVIGVILAYLPQVPTLPLTAHNDVCVTRHHQDDPEDGGAALWHRLLTAHGLEHPLAQEFFYGVLSMLLDPSGHPFFYHDLFLYVLAVPGGAASFFPWLVVQPFLGKQLSIYHSVARAGTPTLNDIHGSLMITDAQNLWPYHLSRHRRDRSCPFRKIGILDVHALPRLHVQRMGLRILVSPSTSDMRMFYSQRLRLEAAFFTHVLPRIAATRRNWVQQAQHCQSNPLDAEYMWFYDQFGDMPGFIR